MTPTLFLDADVVLDLLAKREPWFEQSAAIFSKIQSGEFYGATSVLVFANVFYILRRIKGQKAARATLQKLKSLLKVMATSEASLEIALHSTFTDFEDGIQYFTAQSGGANLLITRNIKDYKTQNLAVMTPLQFLESLGCH
ncbi:PIN domain-containing protein [Endozoicomonas sp. GU-1]|uniref:type II toxin-antitoxin system VapC family toxin n=1 Tax=Endozoicomonas sp. GU-1 TaxID=3009078 RepID=UPI0022B2DE9C|nr:PIN domain-containing protein [Endozoicomonas sp. GU-1]WBA82888.1 PIN domain-containing protein [Endozoicomonas sp. GU-1]WBA85815.1 PIN domain-containing protein [Endozoicomonas sp. GU-1]